MIEDTICTRPAETLGREIRYENNDYSAAPSDASGWLASFFLMSVRAGVRFRGHRQLLSRASDLDKTDRLLPFRQLSERLSKDISTLGFGAGVDHTEGFLLVQVVQPLHVDTLCVINTKSWGSAPT